MGVRIGVDVGGTFTDLIICDESSGKIRAVKGLTTPGALAEAVARVVSAVSPDGGFKDETLFLHGTTMALNAVIERKGAKVGLLTTRGFRDVLELRRGERDRMYDLCWKSGQPLVPRRLRLPVTERVRSGGQIEIPLDVDDVERALTVFEPEDVTCIAVAFLNAYANPKHELAARTLLRELGFAGEISLSHEVSGEYREYERTSTAVIDAYVRPKVTAYLGALARKLEPLVGEHLFVTNSGGGAMTFDEAAARPFETIDSGPAAGAVGAGELCRDLGVALAITADVGGTSFDTCLIIDGRPPIKYEGRVGDLVVQTPWLDVRSIGSGGGSIAYIDEGGLLRVGPESAGADPGPACYGQGGIQATVTDAAAVLGMLALGQLADGVVIDVQAARKTLEPLAASLSMTVRDVAIGVITIATAQMADAIREVTGERGQDPREAALLAFGGAGPLFATLLAQELEIERIIVPPYAGNFSAWGLLGQDLLRSAATTSVASLTAEGLTSATRELRELFDQLIARSSSSGLDQQPEAALDMRYRGQDYTLTIPVSLGESDGTILGDPASISEAFSSEYERVFGHALDDPVEIVSVRATLRTALPRGTVKPATSERSVETVAKAPTHSAWSYTRGADENFAVVDRASLTPESRLDGPAIVLEETTTTYVDAGFELTVHPSGALVISNPEPDRDRSRRAAEMSGTDSGSPGSADPVLTEVVRQGLLSAAEQMKIALRRTAFSPMVYDMIDFCCALYDREVRLLAQAQATPLFLGTMGFCIEACVHAVGGEEALEPGDVLFSTYGYDIGSHPQDAAIVVPAFLKGSLIGYAAVKAHHMDIGAVEPFCTNTTDNFQEGAIFPGVRIFRGGKRDEDMYRTVLANSRLPAALAGDLNAQIVAANVGLAALSRLIERYGSASFRAAVERTFDHGESTVRHFLERIPDGRYTGTGAMDNDGLNDQLVPFVVAAEVAGSNVVVDFVDCPPQQAGPINCPFPTTVSAARLAIVAIAGGGESASEGHFRPIEVRTKPGTMFHAQAPAPIYLYGWPATQAIDTIHQAIAEVMPEAVSAGSGGDFCGMVWWGRRRATGEFWAGGTDHVTGQGATHNGDGGAPLMHISFSGMRNTAAETLELRHPLLVERFELTQDSGGAGRFRGGPGVDIRYRMLEDGYFTSPIERTRTRPWGLRNGKPARPNSLRVLLPDGSTRALAKTTAFAVPEESVIEFSVGGGGGYGAPSERDPRAVLEDIEDGFVSVEAARRDYPHAFPPGLKRAAVVRDRVKA